MTGQSERDPERVHSLDDPQLLAALEANTSAAYADCARNLQGEVVVTPQMTHYVSSEPISVFNGVAQAQLKPDNLDAEIDRALRPFLKRRLPMLWWIGPSSHPDDLSARLLAHGLTHDGDAPGMAADLRAINQASASLSVLTIRSATTSEALSDWAHVAQRGFGFPRTSLVAIQEMALRQCLRPDPQWVYFLGRLGGRPVATSALFFSAGVAGVYCVATIADARRQGIGAEMTRAALSHAREMGFDVGILQSSEMGFHVYQELGFRTITTFGLYAWPGSDR